MEKEANCLGLQDRQEGCTKEIISKMTSSRSSAKGQRIPGKRICMYKDAEAQETCCSRPVQFASVRLLARAVVGDKTRGLDRREAGRPRSQRASGSS